ncbi:MAG: site-specific DNA-methyltransferase, partial [Acidovorax sp.]|nr:site-specific DNA-methyltransferase [Acidovorax sp.]
SSGQPAALHGADWSDWPQDLPQGGLLYHGDNKDVLAHLLANGFRGKVKLIYIDPPFDSGADYVRKVQLRGAKGTVKIDGEDYTLGEQVQYSDIWANDNYLQFMYERLLMLRELLDEGGSIAVHCDFSKGHYLRLILDEVFGEKNFVNDITWYYENKPQFGFMKHLPHDHDLIFVYAKNYGDHCLNHQQVPVKEVQQQAVVAWDPVLKKRIAKRDEDGNIIYETRNEKYMGSVWTIPLVHPIAKERTGYPTQKPEPLLERILKVFSNHGDLVLDCFMGSGTSLAVSQHLGRRWIGCDINKGAIQTTAKRIQELMRAQAATATAPQQGDLVEGDDTTPPRPSQLGFATYRVNDYDLQVQHNEAVELACQHLGVARTRT